MQNESMGQESSGSSAEEPQRPLHLCSFESRRAEEMRSLIERQGGRATLAPSMREIPLTDNPAVFEFMEQMLDGRIDIVVFLTGVGARALLDVVKTRYEESKFFDALQRCQVVVRGPKPFAVLREWKVRIDVRVPEPNTWRELLATLDAEAPQFGRRIAIQEYGQPNEALYRALEQRGAEVVRVPVYRWGLPEDTHPLETAIRGTIGGEFDALLFTSAQQIAHVQEVARKLDEYEAWRTSAQRCVIGSIGPTCTEALEAAGLPADLEASPPKMGQLVRAVLQRTPQLLAEKRKPG